MPIDLSDPKMAGYTPLESIVDQDQSSRRIRDMPYGKHREALTLYPSEIVFGNAAINTETPPQTVLLRNQGYDSVSIAGITVVGDFVNGSAPITEILPNET